MDREHGERGSSLQKGEMLIGLGRGRQLHLYPTGRIAVEGGKIKLPHQAFYFYPLIAEIASQEFLGPGQFQEIVELEKHLDEHFGGPTEIYKKTGPILAGLSIEANRVAKVILELSPIKTKQDTGEISKDAYQVYEEALTIKIAEYYPGSTKSRKKRQNSLMFGNKGLSGKKGKDGLPF